MLGMHFKFTVNERKSIMICNTCMFSFVEKFLYRRRNIMALDGLVIHSIVDELHKKLFRWKN